MKMIFFVEAKNEKKKHLNWSQFFFIYSKTFIFTQYIKNSRPSASNTVKHACCLLKKMATKIVKILALDVSVKLQIVVSEDSFIYIIFAENNPIRCIHLKNDLILSLC